MASGDTLLIFTVPANEPPSSNYATIGTVNSHPVLRFDQTTQEEARFSGIMPRHYGGGGITVYVHWMAATTTTGTIGWDISLERLSDGTTDLDSDSYASAQAITPATVPGADGQVSITNVAISSGANMDNVVAGDLFRLRIRRDVANDNTAGDAELLAIEIKET